MDDIGGRETYFISPTTHALELGLSEGIRYIWDVEGLVICSDGYLCFPLVYGVIPERQLPANMPLPKGMVCSWETTHVEERRGGTSFGVSLAYYMVGVNCS